jgi:outer membrane protein insertion porin family
MAWVLWWRTRSATVIACLCLAALPLLASAASASDTIQAIKVEGNQRIEDGTIRGYMVVQPGDPFDPDRLDRSLETLYATGLFQDVRLDRQGNTLVVHVAENPLVNRVAFEGNHKLSDDQLGPEIQLKPRRVYIPALTEADRQHILDVYRQLGWFATVVEPKVIGLDHNRVDVVFSITEGPTIIGRVAFEGNHAFSDRVLRGVVSSKQDGSWCWSVVARTYSPERLKTDRELLRRFYLKYGYADFVGEDVTAGLSPDRKSFVLTFRLSEGERYRNGKASVSSSFRGVPSAKLTKDLDFPAGAWYDGDVADRTTEALTNDIRSLGVLIVQVTPQITRHPETHTIDIVYNVEEGPRVYVERIDIVGNTRTDDKVIRREFLFAEGDPFSLEDIRETQKRLGDLGYFRAVHIAPTPGSAPDMAIITTEVMEKATGSVGAGIHVGADHVPSLDLALKELNFLGQGQSVIADVDLSREGTKGEVSFTEPYLADRNIRGKWGIQFSTGSSNELTTLFAGFRLTLWAGILVFPMPLLLLLLLQGAYYSYLWSDDQARCWRHFKRTMVACKATILLQVTYFALAQVPLYAFKHSGDVAEYASHFVCE